MERDREFPDPLSIAGKKFPRVDAFEKATGLGQYTGDIRLSNMLHGALLRSPYAHARINSIETNDAEGIPGVKAVITYKNTIRKPFNSAAVEAVFLPPNKPIEDQHIFDQTVRFIGEPVAAVAAVTHRVAKEALKAIRVSYELLPSVFDPQEAMAPGAAIVHEANKNNLLVHVSNSSGNMAEALGTSDEVVENTYGTSRQKHCQMEPNICIAGFEGSGTLTVWSPTQMPHLVRGMLAKLFNFPVDKVRVISPLIGGAFGNRLGMVAEPYAVALAMKTGGTVRIEYDREEDFYGSESRHPSVIHVKLGGKREGNLHFVQMEATTNTGAYATHGRGVIGVLGNKLPGPYKCSNIKYDGYSVYSNSPTSGAFRGYGGPQANFAVESQIDELCDKLRIDPMEFRMKNLKEIGEVFRGGPIKSCGIAECILRGAERIGWKEKRRWKVDRTHSKLKGVGMACAIWVSGTQPNMLEATTSVLKINEDGTVNLLMGCTDPGTGSKTTISQICAEELGVRFEDVHVTYGDTNVTPFDVGSHASRTCFVSGGAVLRAAADAKTQVLEAAAKLLEANVADLLIKDRVIHVKGNPERNILIREVAQDAYYRGQQFIGRASYSPRINPPSFAAQFAEVEVDQETGEVKVISFVAAQDCGRTINPNIVRGIVLGGIVQGMGFALTEEFRIDETGKPLNPNFTDYKLLTALDVPEIEIIFIETIEPSGPFGAKGVGEIAILPTAPAIANAIYHATGVRIRELPMTPERVFYALKPKSQ